MRRRTLTFDEVLKVQAEAEALLAGNEHEVDSRRVLELVRDSNCSAYDCEFIALAARLGTNVVTMDGKMLKEFPQHASRISACRRELNSHEAASPANEGTLEATPRRPRSAPHSAVRRSWPAPWSALAQEAGPWRLRQPWFTRAPLPNRSFKPSPNGGPPGPGRRYAVHYLRPGPGVPPSVPA